MKNSKIEYVDPLTGLEDIKFENKLYEAFYTSGGTSTLPKTFESKLDYLDYKTVRFPGHCNLIKLLLELGFADKEEIEIDGKLIAPREMLVYLLSKNLSYESKDMVLLRVTAEGERRKIFELIDYEKEFTAMARTTAYPAALSSILITESEIKGAMPQEVLIELEKKDIIIKKKIEKI
ncbi:MAG: hypothetical protein B5M53_12340 [Candidatus Cloacimonas sp. 4484_209]|nr:MAG: hypothetical protein B5M53_12340 [Candidatus Cloacimonas sp. 4484_209]